MSYGLKVVNDDSYIQIDSDTPRLCAIHSGTYQAVDSRVAVVNFPTPITTIEPPCIFIQNSSTQPDYVYDGAYLKGSSGNWTGFELSVANVTWRPTGKWFCAVFASQAQDDFGMRLWSAEGKVIFDSGTTPVVVTRATNVLDYRGYYNYETLGSVVWYSFNFGSSSPMLSDEYFMINPFSRDVPYRDAIVFNTGIKWDWGANELRFYTFTNIPGAGWTDRGGPGAVFARLPGT